MNQQKQISTDNVVRLASDCTQQYINEMGWNSLNDIRISVTDIYETVIYPMHDISLDTTLDLGEYSGQRVLGKMIPSEKIILIDKSINEPSGDPRFPFTLSHEIGHALLHMGEDTAFK